MTAATSAATWMRCLKLADWSGFPARRRAAGKRGLLAGIGIANYVESPVGIPTSASRSACAPTAQSSAWSAPNRAARATRRASPRCSPTGSACTPENVRLVDRRHRGGGVGRRHPFRSLDADRRHADGRGLGRASSSGRARCLPALVGAARRARSNFTDGFFVSPRTNRRLDVFDIARAIETDASLPPELRAPRMQRRASSAAFPAYPTGARCARSRSIRETGARRDLRATPRWTTPASRSIR